MTARATWLWMLMVALLAVGCSAPSNQATTLDRARFLRSDSPTPPASLATAPIAQLPHRWSDEGPNDGGTGFYRFEIRTDQERRSLGVLLGNLNMNAEVFIDGRYVGGGGDFDGPVRLYWNRPLFVPYDNGELGETHTLDVRLLTHAGDWGGLGPIQVGPEPALRATYERQLAMQVVPAQIATVLSGALVLLFGALWLGASRRAMYGYFVLAALFFTGHSLAFHVSQTPLPFWLSRFAIHFGLDWFCVWQLRAFHRWLGIERPRLEQAVLGIAAVASVSTFVISFLESTQTWFTAVATGFHLVLSSLLPYALLLMWQRRKALRRVEAIIVVLGTLVVSAVAFHALAAHLGMLPRSSPRLLYLVGPVLLVCFGAIMLADFFRLFRTAQRLNVELDLRVKQKEALLVENYERVRKLEHERILSDERERIMREMHDGVGGSLVSMLSLVEGKGADRDEIAGALRDALVDMRVVIDSLDPSVDDITTLLGMLRSRIQPRLEQSGIRLWWRVNDLEAPSAWGPQHLLHVMRIVQESVTNIIKHADATQIVVETGRQAPDGQRRSFVQIEDDGRGLRAEGAGRGLSNMRARASAIGADLLIQSPAGSSAGTRILLLLPSAPDQSASNDNSPREAAS